MDEIKVEKIEERYKLQGTNPRDDSKIKVNLVVHLNNEHRTVSITGKNNMFEFRQSDPYLIKGMIELFEKALEVADQAQRVKLPKEEKS